MAGVRMTRKQLAKLTGQAEEPPKPLKKPRQEARRVEKAARVVIPAIGQKYRVARRLWFDNPPLVGTVLTIWRGEFGLFYLEESEAGGAMFAATGQQLGEYFLLEEEVVSE